MKNTLAVAKREFRSAFDLPIAYVFIAAFLILATLGGLAGFFDRGVSDLRDYFAGLRYAFVLFAPAVSMRLWAEERRSRTFELLFTLPVRPWEAVVGKFLGALALVAVALALGAVLPLTLSAWAHFDVGAVLAGYLGVLLLAAVEVALGLLVSALTDNQIVAFVGAAVASFLLLVAGEPALLGEAERFSVPETLVPVRSALLSLLGRVGTGGHQEALARGVLDTRDVVYFVALSALFLFANVIAVERRHRRLEAALSVLLALAAFFLVEDVATRRSLRFDLTSRRAFSLGEGTKKALEAVNARLTIRLYLSHDLPASQEREKRALLDLLHEVEAHGGSNVHLEVYDPKGDERIAEQARREGITSRTLQQIGRESVEAMVLWDGVSLLYAGKPPVAFPFALYKPNIEYDLAVAIKKLVQKEPQRVAWIDAAPPQARGKFGGVRSQLAKSYTVEDFDLRGRPSIPKDYQTAVLVLDAPAASATSERELYELDQFVMRGGALVVLMEPMSVDWQGLTRATPIDWGKTGRALERWGVSVRPRLVLALAQHMQRWQIPSASSGGPVVTFYPYFLQPDSLANAGSPVAAQTGMSFFPFAGEVAAVASAREGAVATALVSTPKDSWTVEGVVDLDPRRIVVPRQGREPRTIAAAISGAIPSAFEGPVPLARPGETDPLATWTPRTSAGRVVVFGDTDFVRDSTREINPEAFGANVTIFLNTIDWATQDASLATMRTRGGLEPLDAKDAKDLDRARAIAWSVNLLLVPLLVGLAGIARFLLRRRAGRRAAARSRKGVVA